MSWLVAYSSIAVVVAAGAFVWGGWVRPQETPAPNRPGWTALLVGALWPILPIALAQLGVVMAVAKLAGSGRGSRSAGRPAPEQPTRPPRFMTL